MLVTTQNNFLNTLKMTQEFFVQLSKIKFCENLFSCYEFVLYVGTDRQTDTDLSRLFIGVLTCLEITIYLSLCRAVIEEHALKVQRC
jgi:hypothetical protein